LQIPRIGKMFDISMAHADSCGWLAPSALVYLNHGVAGEMVAEFPGQMLASHQWLMLMHAVVVSSGFGISKSRCCQ
jgi:hypothetical protein